MTEFYNVTLKNGKTVPFTVDAAPGRAGFFYAKAPGFGCSKDYPSADFAIRAMCGDHCAVVVCIAADICFGEQGWRNLACAIEFAAYHLDNGSIPAVDRETELLSVSLADAKAESAMSIRNVSFVVRDSATDSIRGYTHEVWRIAVKADRTDETFLCAHRSAEAAHETVARLVRIFA
jgi:hypothetical protein